MEFKKVIAGAFSYVLKCKHELARALLLPFIAYVAIDASMQIDMNKYAYFSLYALSIGVQAIFAITTHRVVLLGPGSVSKWGITSWSERETVFVIHILALSVLMVPMMTIAVIPVIGLFVATALTCWVFGRLSLVFPGIALDKGVSFRQSWELTKNHQVLMFLVVVIFPLMLAIPAIILDSMPYTFLLASLVSTFVVVFQVSALSMAYLLITEQRVKITEYDRGQSSLKGEL